jgi:hypothetical protein
MLRKTVLENEIYPLLAEINNIDRVIHRLDGAKSSPDHVFSEDDLPFTPTVMELPMKLTDDEVEVIIGAMEQIKELKKNKIRNLGLDYDS